MSKEVEQIINTLCDKLGVAANILVPELTKYSIARLTFMTAVYSIAFAVIAVVIVKIAKWALNQDLDFDDVSLYIFLLELIPGLLLIVLTITIVSNATGLIGWIASPTASAIKEITSMIK